MGVSFKIMQLYSLFFFFFNSLKSWMLPLFRRVDFKAAVLTGSRIAVNTGLNELEVYRGASSSSSSYTFSSSSKLLTRRKSPWFSLECSRQSRERLRMKKKPSIRMRGICESCVLPPSPASPPSLKAQSSQVIRKATRSQSSQEPQFFFRLFFISPETHLSP